MNHVELPTGQAAASCEILTAAFGALGGQAFPKPNARE